MNFSQVKAVTIPEGNVKQISVNGTVIWSAIRNVFDKTKLSEYGYRDDVYDLDGVEAVKIYDTTDNGISVRQGFAEGKQYKITSTARYVSTHGVARLTAYYSDGTYDNLKTETLTSGWKTFTAYSASGKSLTRLRWHNAGNGIGYAYYLNIDDLEIVEV